MKLVLVPFLYRVYDLILQCVNNTMFTLSNRYITLQSDIVSAKGNILEQNKNRLWVELIDELTEHRDRFYFERKDDMNGSIIQGFFISFAATNMLYNLRSSAIRDFSVDDVVLKEILSVKHVTNKRRRGIKRR